MFSLRLRNCEQLREILDAIEYVIYNVYFSSMDLFTYIFDGIVFFFKPKADKYVKWSVAKLWTCIKRKLSDKRNNKRSSANKSSSSITEDESSGSVNSSKISTVAESSPSLHSASTEYVSFHTSY